MEYLIHGQKIEYDPRKECGLYKQRGLNFDYAVMDPDMLVDAINKLDKPTAIAQTTALREMVSGQVGLSQAPANLGSPVLISVGHHQVPIEEVRPNLQNLVDFTDKVLRALQGK